jgi:hypothetical protein
MADIISNNEIIQKWVQPFVAKINADKVALNIRHDRNKPPTKSRYKFKKVAGEIVTISITMNKGEIMSHKGKGKSSENRVEKKFFTPNADVEIPQLADAIAENTADIICFKLCI